MSLVLACKGQCDPVLQQGVLWIPAHRFARSSFLWLTARQAPFSSAAGRWEGAGEDAAVDDAWLDSATALILGAGAPIPWPFVMRGHGKCMKSSLEILWLQPEHVGVAGAGKSTCFKAGMAASLGEESQDTLMAKDLTPGRSRAGTAALAPVGLLPVLARASVAAFLAFPLSPLMACVTSALPYTCR